MSVSPSPDISRESLLCPINVFGVSSITLGAILFSFKIEPFPSPNSIRDKDRLRNESVRIVLCNCDRDQIELFASVTFILAYQNHNLSSVPRGPHRKQL